MGGRRCKEQANTVGSRGSRQMYFSPRENHVFQSGFRSRSWVLSSTFENTVYVMQEKIHRFKGRPLQAYLTCPPNKNKILFASHWRIWKRYN
jgi:hypothetical protein